MMHGPKGAEAIRLVSRRAVISAAAGVALILSGCDATGRDALRPRSQTITPRMIEKAIAESPVGPDEALRPLTINDSAECSMHIIQFRTGEGRHIHRDHDLTFIVFEGMGDVFVNDARYEALAGDVFHIPRGVPHYCRNRGESPLVAVLIFTPPFDGQDSVPMPLGERAYTRE